MRIKFWIYAILFLTGCKTIAGGSTSTNSRYTTTSSGLQYKILKKGEGRAARNGESILMFETTSYRDGTILYSNEHTSSLLKY